MQDRLNSFYSTCRASDVMYIPAQPKQIRNTIWCTMATKKSVRGESLKKDISLMDQNKMSMKALEKSRKKLLKVETKDDDFYDTN